MPTAQIIVHHLVRADLRRRALEQLLAMVEHRSGLELRPLDQASRQRRAYVGVLRNTIRKRSAAPDCGAVRRKETDMAYVVAAKWRARPGKADRLLEVIEEMTPPSRAEPGCVFYQAQRSEEDPNLFFLYEQYADEAGYEAHQETEHFTRLVKQEAIPELLAAREREFYSTIGDHAGGLSS